MQKIRISHRITAINSNQPQQLTEQCLLLWEFQIHNPQISRDRCYHYNHTYNCVCLCVPTFVETELIIPTQYSIFIPTEYGTSFFFFVWMSTNLVFNRLTETMKTKKKTDTQFCSALAYIPRGLMISPFSCIREMNSFLFVCVCTMLGKTSNISINRGTSTRIAGQRSKREEKK